MRNIPEVNIRVLRAHQVALKSGKNSGGDALLFRWWHKATLGNEADAAATFFGFAAEALARGDISPHWLEYLLDVGGKNVAKSGCQEKLIARCTLLSKFDQRARRALRPRRRGAPVRSDTFERRLVMAWNVRELRNAGAPLEDNREGPGALSRVADKFKVHLSTVEAAYSECREYIELLGTDRAPAEGPDTV